MLVGWIGQSGYIRLCLYIYAFIAEFLLYPRKYCYMMSIKLLNSPNDRMWYVNTAYDKLWQIIGLLYYYITLQRVRTQVFKALAAPVKGFLNILPLPL